MASIECVSAAGVTQPPFMTFRALHTSYQTSLRPQPISYRLALDHEQYRLAKLLPLHEWITRVFEPSTTPAAYQRRLLYVDVYTVISQLHIFPLPSPPPHLKSRRTLRPSLVGFFPVLPTILEPPLFLHSSRALASRKDSGE